MYRNALNIVGEIVTGADVGRVYIQQRDFKDHSDIISVIGNFINKDETLAVVRTNGITGMEGEAESYAYKMQIDIDIFAPTDAVREYAKSSEANFDKICLAILKSFKQQTGHNVKQADGESAALYVSTIKTVTPKTIVDFQEANKPAHSVTFSLECIETI